MGALESLVTKHSSRRYVPITSHVADTVNGVTSVRFVVVAGVTTANHNNHSKGGVHGDHETD